jgi:hypothetical protein
VVKYNAVRIVVRLNRFTKFGYRFRSVQRLDCDVESIFNSRVALIYRINDNVSGFFRTGSDIFDKIGAVPCENGEYKAPVIFFGKIVIYRFAYFGRIGCLSFGCRF